MLRIVYNMVIKVGRHGHLDLELKSVARREGGLPWTPACLAHPRLFVHRHYALGCLILAMGKTILKSIR